MKLIHLNNMLPKNTLTSRWIDRRQKDNQVILYKINNKKFGITL